MIRLLISKGLSLTAGFKPPNDLSITFCLGPLPFPLELQQMVEVCSRAPAIGECVCRGLVLRCVAIESTMMHGRWPTFGILLQSPVSWRNHWASFTFAPLSLLRLSSDRWSERSSAWRACVWNVWLNGCRDYPKKARLHFRSIQTERRGCTLLSFVRPEGECVKHFKFASAAV